MITITAQFLSTKWQLSSHKLSESTSSSSSSSSSSSWQTSWLSWNANDGNLYKRTKSLAQDIVHHQHCYRQIGTNPDQWSDDGQMKNLHRKHIFSKQRLDPRFSTTAPSHPDNCSCIHRARKFAKQTKISERTCFQTRFLLFVKV